MPTPESSRRNLSKVVRTRSAEESLRIQQRIEDWELTGEAERRPKTQAALARELGVSQQYVAKIAKRVKQPWLGRQFDSLDRRPVASAAVPEANKRRVDFAGSQARNETDNAGSSGSSSERLNRISNGEQHPQTPADRMPTMPQSSHGFWKKPRTYLEWQEEAERGRGKPVRRLIVGRRPDHLDW